MPTPVFAVFAVFAVAVVWVACVVPAWIAERIAISMERRHARQAGNDRLPVVPAP